jgi:peptide/nickel transport system permease protein
MSKYIAKRLVQVFPTLLLVSLLVFFLHRFIPGDIITMLQGELGSDYDATKVRELLGLNTPAPLAYLQWMWGVVQGDFGQSVLGRTSILAQIGWRWPVTVELAVLAMFFTIIIGIPIGVLAAVRQETWMDYVSRSIAVLGLSLPTFWIGVMVVTLSAIYLNWLPRQDYVSFTADPLKNLSMFLIPSVILAFNFVARVMRMMRGTLLEVLRQDYIRTAWAKGLRERVVLYRHGAKNAMIPVMTLLGLEFVNLLAGTVVIEVIFDLPGIGHYTLEALQFRDYGTVQAIIFLYAVVVVVVNLLTDLSYAFLDPRVKYS